MPVTTAQNRKMSLAWIVLGLVCLLLIGARSAQAQQSSSAIAQGYQVASESDDIVAGALVSIKTENNVHTVELATSDSAEQLAGVVDDKPLVTISADNQQVQVVISGTTNVLVSDINGPIKSGDKITVSPVAGVGMLATADSQVVGTAQADLKTGSTRDVTDKDGKTHTIRIGRVPVQVGVAYYQAPGSNFLPPFIQNIANSVAGRPVSLIRILICTAIMLIGFISVAVLIYSSVRSAMTSLGRNPLAAHAIRRGLYQAIAVAVIIVGGMLLSSYLILSV